MNFMKSAALWILITVGIILFVLLYNTPSKPKNLKIFEVLDLARTGQIVKLQDRDGNLTGEYKDSNDRTVAFKAEYLPGQMEPIFERLETYGVMVYDPQRDSEIFKLYFLPFILPLLIILGFWFFLMRSIQSGGNKAMSFGKSKARLVHQGQTNVTFNDVAGVEEAKQELQEVVEFLKDPQKFSRLGAKIPKGVLLYGPPGTGKTLLAKAVAGEANVPFFSISGSDFVEMFVGVGASRVRDLFEQGKKHKPCLIFMDEIDAVGRHRFAGLGGGHDEREQTLNQLLVEMDGFNTNEGIILIAATNRADVLDPALLRPGRFDRRIVVDYPDVHGREKILEVHLKNVKHDDKIDLGTLARSTMGFSGADLANMVNEAALLAARQNKDKVMMSDIEEAKDRVIMGPERRSIRQIAKDKEIVAYHEAGHALTAKYLAGTDPVHKVTIIPRGKAMGVTAYLPNEDLANLSRINLKNKLVTIMGGRSAEEIHFGEYTTGAAGDIQQATHLAHKMICEFGMSDELGPRAYGDGNGQIFLGKDITRERNYSEASATMIDQEVQKFIKEAHFKAREILTEHQDVMDSVAAALLERETLTNADLDVLIAGRELPPLAVEPKLTGPPKPEIAVKLADGAKAKTPPPLPNLEPGSASA